MQRSLEKMICGSHCWLGFFLFLPSKFCSGGLLGPRRAIDGGRDRSGASSASIWVSPCTIFTSIRARRSRAIAGAQLLGASKIIGADLNEKKKEKAGVFGMTDFIDAKEVIDKSITDVVKEMTGGFGVDYSFECTGAETLINQALEATKPGAGVTIVVGANKKETAQINNLLLLFGKTLKGSLFGGIKPHSNLPFIVQKCINKEIQLDELLTQHVKLEDLNHALELLKDSDCLKVVVEITEN